MKKTALLGAVALACVMNAAPASALNIILRADSSFSSAPNGAAALFAFRKAANYWNTVLTNDVTLNFRISYQNLGSPNTIAQAGSNALTTTARSVYQGLANQSATALDSIAVANLRPLSAAGGVGYRMPDSVTGVAGTGNGLGLETVTRGSVFDNDDTFNNLFMAPNTANAKVLGINFDYGTQSYNGENIDATLTFNSTFAFDLDPTNGVSVGTQDFTSVAIHEMGHALGFVSGADTYDFYANPNGPGRTGPFGNTFDWDRGQFFPQFGGVVTPEVLSVWDLFRYSGNGGATGFDLTTGKRYLQLDPNRAAFFSIDAVNPFNALNLSVAEYANLSTGRYNGDGQQASHWKDANGFFDINNCFIAGGRQIGIMDPTSGSCQVGLVTANDLAAFDAMGYNLNFNVLQNRDYVFDTAQVFALDGLASVPEPASWAMMVGGFGLLGGMVRRRRPTVSVTFA